MLNQVKQRLQQTSNSFKVTMQGKQAVKSTLSENEISVYLEQMVSNKSAINIDEQDLSILNEMAYIQMGVLECDEEQLNTALPLLFEGIAGPDCIIAYTNLTPEFSLESCYLILQEIEKSANSVNTESLIVFPNDFIAEKLQLFVFFRFGYKDEELVQFFTAELKQNPKISVAALQRKYSLSFNRVIPNLELAKQYL